MKRLQADELIIGGDDGPQIRLKASEITAFDAGGQTRFQLLLERGSGIPVLSLCDGNGTGQVSIQVEENGCPSVTLRDGNFTQRLTLELGEDEGDPEVHFYDISGDRLGVLGSDWQGDLQLRIVNKAGLWVPWVPTPEGTNEQPTVKREV